MKKNLLHSEIWLAYIVRINLLKLFVKLVLNHRKLVIRFRQQIHQTVNRLMIMLKIMIPHSSLLRVRCESCHSRIEICRLFIRFLIFLRRRQFNLIHAPFSRVKKQMGLGLKQIYIYFLQLEQACVRISNKSRQWRMKKREFQRTSLNSS